MERQRGYYWVLDKTGQHWYVAHWCGRFWELPGNEFDFFDRDFLSIADAPLQDPGFTVLDIKQDPEKQRIDILLNTSKNKKVE